MSDNVLLLLVDQLRLPRFAYGSSYGLLQSIKNILAFVDNLDANSPDAKYFPGFMKLRRNAVMLDEHAIAASACTPSRSVMMTGQYGTRTGVTQTDGMFKSGDAVNFPWLAPNGIPTIGDWFRAAGYSTHYFGKWHVSHPPDQSLEEWGFSDWEASYPEPHGQYLNNLGTYRDIGFADLATTFLKRRGLGLWWNRAQAEQQFRDPSAAAPDGTPQPFFCVVSLTNPHDIATYPVLPRLLEPLRTVPTAPVLVPEQSADAPLPQGGTMSIPLNPANFPQTGAAVPPAASLKEDLLTKPSCQYDMSYKVGFALASAAGANASRIGLPFQMTSDPDGWCAAFMQYYAYLMHVVDARILEILDALDESGLRGNTIVVFTADHGEYGAAHGMMIEKWHTAYEEILRVPFVVSRPTWTFGADGKLLGHVEQATSHVDLAPTLLGLAGQTDWASLQAKMVGHWPVPFVGVDLSPQIDAAAAAVGVAAPPAPPAITRAGVLFITYDTITETLPDIGDPHSDASNAQYEVYLELVEDAKADVTRLASGPIVQPCLVHCLRTPTYKLVRYFDPSGAKADQWEFYSLQFDGLEVYNLTVFDKPFPTLVDSTKYPPGATFTPEQLLATANQMLADLQTAEQTLLPPYAG